MKTANAGEEPGIKSRHNALGRWTAIAVISAGLLAGPGTALAHCDTLDGPVVGAARKALDTGNVNLALVWVQKKDEADVRNAFQKASAVRKAGGQAKDLADHHFFETVVRVHRAGEGAPYTGLKPAGKPEPAVAAADKALESGKLDGVVKLISQKTHEGLEQQFKQALAKKKYSPNDVEAGRAYTGAYVQYVHYVEGLHEAAAKAGEHAHEKAPAHAEERPHAH
jgi:hypothetical protein